MNNIFYPLLDKKEEDDLKIERFHRSRKPPNLSADLPQDVIVSMVRASPQDKRTVGGNGIWLHLQFWGQNRATWGREGGGEEEPLRR